ncbi:MAG: hypothetical protein ABR936_13820 [Bacteroidota bacterium]|jgi:hypothetical protein
MLKNNNHRTKPHRGSSPPFQETEQGLHEWEIELKSTYQYSDDSPYIQLLEPQLDQEEESDGQESDARQRKDMRTGKDSIGDAEFQRNQDDEDHWQDDGGESG